MEKGFFHPDRGYWQALTDPSIEVRAAYPEGTIEVALPPTPLHKMVAGQWVAPTQEEIDADAAASIRSQRDVLLATNVDPIATNSLRWAGLSAEQQQALGAYRQALLDVPQQAGFPHNVVWPEKPTL
jgi:hypothetical protein